MYDSIQRRPDLARNISVVRVRLVRFLVQRESKAILRVRPDRPAATGDTSRCAVPVLSRPGPSPGTPRHCFRRANSSRASLSCRFCPTRVCRFQPVLRRAGRPPRRVRTPDPPGFDGRFHLSNSYSHIINSFFGTGSDAAPERHIRQRTPPAGETALSVQNRVAVIMNTVFQFPNS